MRLRDLISMSVSNLTQMKLRTALTVSGVLVAIATLTTMLSFGAGNQRYVEEQWEKLGLFHTMRVFTVEKKTASDTTAIAVLDSTALARLAQLPGVRYAFPLDAFTTQVTFVDTTTSLQAQALPTDALQLQLFSQFEAGRAFVSDTASEAMVTFRFLERYGILSADSALGKPIILTVRVASIDSGLVQVLPPDRNYVKNRIQEIEFDSLRNFEYVKKQARTELNNAMSRFLDGFLNHRETISDTLTIVGVIAAHGPRERSMSPLMVPMKTASRMTSGLMLDDPAALMGALQSGRLLASGGGSLKTYRHITLDLEPSTNQAALADSIEALGYRSFSFAEQFEEIQQFFFYFDLALSFLGIIALVTASLGIINTLVMSVLERRREIGVLKSLGADEGDIRRLFLVESATIGFLGAVAGVIVGWLASRVGSVIAQAIMERDGIQGVELFATPIWLILAAVAVGVGVSLLAGLYPARRAARIDPVEALRGD